MNCKTNQLRDAVVLALVVGAGGTAGAAIAQDAGSAGATTLDRIEITGSRIRQVDTETAQPVMLISRDQIEKQGFKSVADILQNIPTAGSPTISRTSPLANGENVGGYYIDLRNLGAARTLVLVDGKRLGTTNGGLQDVSSIPAVAVERIEVLKDGASSIYGSDAIAGVINIITRKHFDGAEAGAYIGQYGKGDGQRQVYDFMMGSSSDRGSLTAGVEYTQEDPVWARNRWFSRDRFPTGEKSAPRQGGLSGTTQYGRFTYTDSAGKETRTLRRDTPGLDPANINSYRALNSSDVSNPALASTVYSGIKRKSAFMNGTFNFSENVRFDTSLLYTDRDSFAQNAGYPFKSTDFALTQGGLSANSVFNPVGNDATGGLPPGAAPQAIQYVRRGWEGAARSAQQPLHLPLHRRLQRHLRAGRKQVLGLGRRLSVQPEQGRANHHGQLEHPCGEPGNRSVFHQCQWRGSVRKREQSHLPGQLRRQLHAVESVDSARLQLA